MIKVLLCDQNKKWLENLSTKLSDGMELVASVDNGKKAQEVLISEHIDAIVINVETKEFSFFEVVKFIKQKKPKVLIILISESQKVMGEYFYNEKEILKLGIAASYIKPFPIYKLVKYIENSFQHKQWTKIVQDDATADSNEDIKSEEVSESDQQFTSLKASSFQHNNMAIFDIFLRLGKNKYMKIFRLGDKIDGPRISKYENENEPLRLFFKTRDRLSYINFTNELIKRQVQSTRKSSTSTVDAVNTSSKLFVEEIYTSGLPAHLIEESVSLCENIYLTIDRNENLRLLLASLVDVENSEELHVSLTAFYTAIICKHVDWVTSHSRDNIILGALLHDIGKIKLSKRIRYLEESKMSAKELAEFQKHPEYGVELLDNISEIPEQVKQIVYQHHELNTSHGYPNGLSAKKIYPLAKIVAFSSFVAERSALLKLSPFDTLRKLIEEKDGIMNYEPFVIKAFLKGFIHNV